MTEENLEETEQDSVYSNSLALLRNNVKAQEEREAYIAKRQRYLNIKMKKIKKKEQWIEAMVEWHQGEKQAQNT